MSQEQKALSVVVEVSGEGSEHWEVVETTAGTAVMKLGEYAAGSEFAPPLKWYFEWRGEFEEGDLVLVKRIEPTASDEEKQRYVLYKIDQGEMVSVFSDDQDHCLPTWIFTPATGRIHYHGSYSRYFLEPGQWGQLLAVKNHWDAATHFLEMYKMATGSDFCVETYGSFDTTQGMLVIRILDMVIKEKERARELQERAQALEGALCEILGAATLLLSSEKYHNPLAALVKSQESTIAFHANQVVGAIRRIAQICIDIIGAPELPDTLLKSR